MTTNRQEFGGSSVRADMGAAVLSMNKSDKVCAEVAEFLTESGVCAEVPRNCLSATAERPSSQNWHHFVGIDGGVNDALKKLLEKAKAEVHYERRVASLDQHRNEWVARPFKGAAESFDAVVIAVPGCGHGGDNLDKIHGNWERLLSPQQSKLLRAVQHDGRWAFAFFFPTKCARELDSFFGGKAVEKRVDDDMLHLVVHQSRKTHAAGGPKGSGAIAIVVHTTTQWARWNARANGRDQRLFAEMEERTKWVLGLDSHIRPLASKVITWKQSQVTRAIPDLGVQDPCMLISSKPPLALAGDYFTESNFAGCLRSACAAASSVAGTVVPDGPSAKRKRGDEKDFDLGSSTVAGG